MPNFYTDLSSNTLPRYSLIQVTHHTHPTLHHPSRVTHTQPSITRYPSQPRMSTSKAGPSNWQHPDNRCPLIFETGFGLCNQTVRSVSAGEQLISDVYTALRNSEYAAVTHRTSHVTRHTSRVTHHPASSRCSYWNNTLLVITYDEHGGFFDHVPPPHDGVPAPDDLISPNVRLILHWFSVHNLRWGVTLPSATHALCGCPCVCDPPCQGFDFSRLGVRVPTVVISPWVKAGTLISQPSPQQKPAPTSQFESTSIISTANKIFGLSESLTRRDAWAATFEDVISSTMRSDCPVTLPAVPALSQQQIEIEMRRELNDHHLDSLNLLCELSLHSHPVCAQHADEESRDTYMRMLGSAATEGQWAHAARYAGLYERAAGRMSQQHFEAASRAMFGAYKSSIAAAAAATAAF